MKISVKVSSNFKPKESQLELLCLDSLIAQSMRENEYFVGGSTPSFMRYECELFDCVLS